MDSDGNLPVCDKDDISTVIDHPKERTGLLHRLNPCPRNSPGNRGHRADSCGLSRFCHTIHDTNPGSNRIGFESREKKGIADSIAFKLLAGGDDPFPCSGDMPLLIGKNGRDGLPEVEPAPDHYRYSLLLGVHIPAARIGNSNRLPAGIYETGMRLTEKHEKRLFQATESETTWHP